MSICSLDIWGCAPVCWALRVQREALILTPDMESNVPGQTPPIEELRGAIFLAIHGDHRDIVKGFWQRPERGNIVVDVKHLTPVVKRAVHLASPAMERVRWQNIKILKTNLLPSTLSLTHPNILEAFGYKFGDSPCLVVPHSPHGNIMQYVEVTQPQPEWRKLQLLQQAASGLSFLHSQKIAHGGVHTSSVAITSQSQLAAKWYDCGLAGIYAKLAVDDPGDSSSMAEGSAITGYEAPEVFDDDGAPTATLERDVFAFGRLILAVMSERQPFWNLTLKKRVLLLAKGENPSPKDHPLLREEDDVLWELMWSCWKTQPAQRCRIGEVMDALALEVVMRKPHDFDPEPRVDSDSISNDLGDQGDGATAPVDDLEPELEGTLTFDPGNGQRLFGLYADIQQEMWTKADGSAQIVAVKYLRCAFGQGGEATRLRSQIRLKREARVWRKLSHPYILPLYGIKFSTLSGQPCLVSPWCARGDLRAHLEAHPDLSRHERLKILIQVAEAILYLHNLDPSIAHGDIKPSNVLMSEHDVLLGDFGLSKALRSLPTGLTTSSAMAGTRGYRAPELLEGEPISEATDVYAFACLMLTVLSGKAPFYGEPTENKLHKLVRNGEIPNKADHLNLNEYDALWDLLERCWAKDPTERLSMEVVEMELQMRARGTE